MLGDFPENHDYPGKSVGLIGKSLSCLIFVTYLNKAATTFPQNRTCLVKHDFLRKQMLFDYNVHAKASVTPFIVNLYHESHTIIYRKPTYRYAKGR